MDLNESVEIKFVGKTNTIFNVVSLAQFNNVYKKHGWVLVNETKEEKPKVEDKPVEEVVEELKTTNEQEIKNINTMKKKANSVNKFNDNIIKES